MSFISDKLWGVGMGGGGGVGVGGGGGDGVARGASEILGFAVQHWHPPHETIRS